LIAFLAVIAQSFALTAEQTPHITVAVLDFDSRDTDRPGFGKQLADVISTKLAQRANLGQVDRTKLDQTIGEQSLTLTGLVDETAAIRVGKIVGAQLIVVGRAVQQEDKTTVVARIISTETTLMSAVQAQGKADIALAERLSDAVVTRLQSVGEALLPSQPQEDEFVALRDALKGKGLPQVQVSIPETHLRHPVPDAAAQLEIELQLQRAGIKVVEPEFTSPQAPARLLVKGEAFSEFVARQGALITCAARVEIRVIDRKTGEVILADRHVARAVDGAENIAAKLALQEVGRRCALNVLERLRTISLAE
jgi:TolB-like protein